MAKTARHFKTAAEHGIYMCLLGANMMSGPLTPSEMEHHSCASPEEWNVHGEKIVKRFFKLHRGKYVNQRAMSERYAALNRINAKSQAMKEAAATRLGKDKPQKKKRQIAPEEKRFKSDLFLDDTDFNELMSDSTPPDAEDEIGGFQVDGDDDQPPAPPTAKPHINGVETKSAIEMYNETAILIGLPKAQLISETRKKKLKLRLEECGGLEGWRAALDKVKTIPGLQGNNDRGWRADLDFLLQAKSFTKLMEGGYDHWKGTKSVNSDADDYAAIAEGVRIGKLARK